MSEPVKFTEEQQAAFDRLRAAIAESAGVEDAILADPSNAKQFSADLERVISAHDDAARQFESAMGWPKVDGK